MTTQQLAQHAGVSLTEAYVVEIGGFVDRDSEKGRRGLLATLRDALYYR